MVVDLSRETVLSYTLDNEKNILMLAISNAVWQAGLYSKLMQHPLILGYKTYVKEDGVIVAFKLKQPAEILWSGHLPKKDKKKHRIVIDIAAKAR